MPKRRSLKDALDRTFRSAPPDPGAAAPGAGGGATWLIKPVETAAIAVRDRLRPVLDDAKVEAIAESLASIGLAAPILVRRDDRADSYVLVAGTHRLEAARRLGWEFIDARIVDGPLELMRLMEIDENLARSDLSPLDRARFLTERKRVYERMNPGSGHGGDRSGPVAVRSFAADAGDLGGFSERTVRRAIEIGEGLADDVADALAETHLAHREGDLRAIARMPHHEQRALIQDIRELDEPPKSLRDVRPPETPDAERAAAAQAVPEPDAGAGPDAEAAPAALEALQRLWLQADDDIRDRFREWIDGETGAAAQ